ncbi:insulinase family protein [Amphibacillus sp. MSJ-3]|uniref:EF-P 5-aminopentanol modification-associated protein YfmF n=1 Tax=Amphibacillus sp. MSJ-3 TaxID=2841505 RepID=UPI001C0ECE32|nr:pitrilysin family protein [Amphibacillus sp. MSJ-3]MBU5595062.1 insulinase family protein [Amphibacillus sp. MSJ-3]
MIDLNERTVEKKGYKLHIVENKKFKTIHIIAKFRSQLSRESITKRALLPFVLQQGTERYPTANAFRRALDDLYGATFSIDGSKKGEQHILTARMSIANQAYLSTDENVLQAALKFFSETIFNPKQENGKFDANIVAKEKQTLKQKITALDDDKMHYANTRMIDEMCKDEPYHLHIHGYPEDLDGISEENLYQYYLEMIEEDPLDIYIMGDFESIDINQLVGSLFDRNLKKIQEQDHLTEDPLVKRSKEVIEEQDVQQGKLHLGYRTHTKFADPDYPALQVFNAIFGGFPSSKLFINVREKNSLAYYAASQFESHKGLLFVFSGIAPQDFEQAKTIILEQMDAMRKGEFTEDQISEAKRLIINQYKETLDDPFGMIEVLYNQRIANSNRSVRTFIEEINQVEKDEIIKIANKLELDTVYFLTAKGGQMDE